MFYATREIGRLYETGRYLHNYALTYALGLAVAPYHHAVQRPRYAEQLAPLNQRGIYVTPARGTHIRYAITTFKYADNNYHVEMQPAKKNTPSFGRAKEIALNSTFEFVVLSQQETLQLPRWVRMGLWRSKAQLDVAVVEAQQKGEAMATASHPLNPLDVTAPFSAFDLISMPPSSLLDQAMLETYWWEAGSEFGTVRLPVGLRYTFPN
ncbi:MAG: type I-D CRISPR-associated protein Cas5/Csc1 [Anaerolineae bacterium]|nr:type I-D CRISPR-associated protein Cas5/Csc1 [Anaerolineae bacterium]